MDFEDNLDILIDNCPYKKRRRVFDELLSKKNKSGYYITRRKIAEHPKLQPVYFLNTPYNLRSLLYE